jgi:RND family efflux transporter MFP subunit
LLLAGVTLLFVYANRDGLRPALAVTGSRAVALKLSAEDLAARPAGQVLFQASGWIEPDPYPVKATSFVEGIVAEVRILDGQFVHRGEVLVVLDDQNLRLAIAQIEAEVAAMEGDLRVLGERIVEAEREIALAGERLATAQAEMDRLQRQSEILHRAGEAIPLIQREDARLAVERQRNAAMEGVRERELREAAAAVARAEEEAQRHKVSGRRAALARHRLDLERTTIRSPIEGMVQRVHVQVGQMVQPASDAMDAATIATLYDPARLQVRVDVALADAGGLAVGMPAQVATEMLPNVRLVGQVASVAGQADLSKNTLQAKVRLIEPHASLRPEMLARVEFLPMPRVDEGTAGGELGMVHALVPEAALLKIAENRAEAWVAAREGTVAEIRQVVLGGARLGGWREVREGINPGETVITSNPERLRPGRRVKVALAPPPTAAASPGDQP